MSADRETEEASLRVLQFGPTEQGAGIENAIRLLCVGLARAKHSVTLVTDGTRYAEEFDAAGVRSIPTDLADRTPTGFWRASRQLKRIIAEFKPDIVHVHARSHTLICLLAGRRPDCFTLHNSHLTHRIGLLDKDWVRPLFPKSKRTIVICEEAAQYVNRAMGVDPADMDLVYNGVDCEAFRPPSEQERLDARALFGVTNDHTLGVFVGRFHEQKNPSALIDLARVLKDAGRSDVRIALVGAGPLLQDLQKKITEQRVDDVCRIYPWMNPAIAAYWAADVCLLPSKHEGFPLIVVEAMAAGCPVVRTRTGGWQATIREGISGYSTDVNAEAFVQTASQVLGDKKGLHRLRAGARQHAVKDLSIQRSIEGTLRVYAAALSSGR